MHSIQINDDYYRLPESWDELTTNQLLHLVQLTSSDIPIEQLKVYMMLYCLQAHVCRHSAIFKDYIRICIGQSKEKVLFKVRKKKYMLLPDEINQLADLFSFLLTKESIKYSTDYKYFVHPQLTVNPYPTFRCRLRKFTGPDNGLLDIRFEQFMYMQHYLDALNREPEQIDRLLACLWHSKKQFDINRLEKDASTISHLPHSQKMVMYWFVIGALSYLADVFPRVFSGSGKSDGRVFDSQMRLLDSLAQSDMTKKPEIKQGLLIDALYTMDESIRRKEEVEKDSHY